MINGTRRGGGGMGGVVGGAEEWKEGGNGGRIAGRDGSMRLTMPTAMRIVPRLMTDGAASRFKM